MITRLSIYIVRQMITWWTVCLCGVILIFLSTQLLRIAPLFAGTQLRLEEILSALGLVCVPVVAWSLTPSMIIAVFATAGRMSADLELTAIDALGIRRSRLVFGPVMITVLGALLSAWLWLEAAPHSVSRLRHLAVELAGRAVIGRVEPNRFVQLAEGLTVFADELDSAGTLYGVFIEDARQGKRSIQFVARQAMIAFNGKKYTIDIQLKKGSAYITPRIDDDRPITLTFESFALQIPLEQFIEEHLDFLPHSLGVLTADLLGQPPGGVAQKIWRYALWRRVTGPLGFLSLALLAVILAFGHSVHLRQGAALALALTIFIIYHLFTRFLENLMHTSRFGALPAALLPVVLPMFIVAVLVVIGRLRRIDKPLK